MQDLIRKTLDRCGYNHEEATEENLLQCFYDYVDSGIYGDLTLEEAIQDYEDGDITLKMICASLMRVR